MLELYDTRKKSISDLNVVPNQKNICGLSFNPDGNLLAIGGMNGVSIFDIRTKKFIWINHKSAVKAMCWTSNTNLITGSGFKDHSLRNWDIQYPSVFCGILQVSTSQITGIEYFKKENQIIVSHGYPSGLSLWNLPKLKFVEYLEMSGLDENSR
jgi:WD40 repeat protein